MCLKFYRWIAILGIGLFVQLFFIPRFLFRIPGHAPLIQVINFFNILQISLFPILLSHLQMAQICYFQEGMRCLCGRTAKLYGQLVHFRSTTPHHKTFPTATLPLPIFGILGVLIVLSCPYFYGIFFDGKSTKIT